MERRILVGPQSSAFRLFVSPVKGKLLKDGWSVPVLGSIADLNISEPGVCLVSSSEARKAVAELKGAHPLAILFPANIDTRGQDLQVLVEDASGRCVIRRRFILQLGFGEVTYMNGTPKKTFKPDSVKVVLSFTKHHTDAETLAFASK